MRRGQLGDAGGQCGPAEAWGLSELLPGRGQCSRQACVTVPSFWKVTDLAGRPSARGALSPMSGFAHGAAAAALTSGPGTRGFPSRPVSASCEQLPRGPKQPGSCVAVRPRASPRRRPTRLSLFPSSSFPVP